MVRHEGGVRANTTENLLPPTRTAEGLADNIIRFILEDKMGNLWFGMYGAGVCCYGGKAFTNYTTAQGLPLLVVRSILEDKAGNLWISTQGGG